jgi:hypothetical protein
MKSIIAALMLYPQKDQGGAGHAKDQTGNVQKRKTFTPQKIADGDLPIVF